MSFHTGDNYDNIFNKIFLYRDKPWSFLQPSTFSIVNTKAYISLQCKPFTLMLCVGSDIQWDDLALKIPTYWYLKSLTDPTRSPMDPTQAQHEQVEYRLRWVPLHWGSALAMYISCCLCQVCLRWVANVNVISGGIQAESFRIKDCKTPFILYEVCF